jgi:asparagine synthase (glutamine-hydrolysing)
MSAICAVFHPCGKPIAGGLLRSMAEVSRHRGPDGIRVWQHKNVGLAHLAFHVTPESTRESQPLRDSSGCLAIVADARLDNREDLISALADRRLGVDDESTDVELLLAAYQHWGHGCLRHLLGDFVFAIWDATLRQFFFARDALGARAACFSWDGRRLLIASEPSQILSVPGFEATLDEAMVVDYLAMRSPSYERTYFSEISYIPPGHGMVVSERGLRKWRYWDPRNVATVRYADERQYAERFRELLEHSTRARMRSIGPVGLSLSGGLDSTLLAAVAAPLVSRLGLPQKRLKTFSYTFDELRSCDERIFIDPVVASCDIDATYVRCDDQWTLRDLETWPVERDAIWWNAFARLPKTVQESASRSGCRVLLDGQFGDALFPLPAGRLRWWFRKIASDRGGAFLGAQELAGAALTGARAVKRRVRPSRSGHPGMDPRLLERTGALDRWRRASSMLQSRLFSPSWARSRGEARKVGNRRGVEIESPYFERRVVEFVAGLPPEQLDRPGRNRWVQRNAMVSSLPELVVERRGKTGLVPLMEKGLLDRERASFLNKLRHGSSVERGYVNGAWLAQAIEGGNLRRTDLFPLWMTCSLDLWLDLQRT